VTIRRPRSIDRGSRAAGFGLPGAGCYHQRPRRREAPQTRDRRARFSTATRPNLQATMAQVKKKAVREAILAAANDLFTAKGYSGTTLSDIAGTSGVTMSNIYNYFPSKLGILYALYEPWLDHRLDKLAADAARIGDPRKRLRKILLSVLRDIPSANNCFANNVLQALSTLAIDESYSRG
jgi:AcrR family transcriptional regulator